MASKSFPPSVKREVLWRSRRCCCLCHKFAGTFEEVHHIIPAADGGPNTLANAIALCFECHAAVGHYNTQHPRGTKYTPEELRKHRDSWWEFCEKHPTGAIPQGPVTISPPEIQMSSLDWHSETTCTVYNAGDAVVYDLGVKFTVVEGDLNRMDLTAMLVLPDVATTHFKTTPAIAADILALPAKDSAGRECVYIDFRDLNPKTTLQIIVSQRADFADKLPARVAVTLEGFRDTPMAMMHMASGQGSARPMQTYETLETSAVAFLVPKASAPVDARDDPNFLGNEARYEEVEGNYDKAEELYKRALSIDPDHANNLGNYALFLANVRREAARAERIFEHALSVDPGHRNNLGNYANFIRRVRGDDEAAKYYERAVLADPSSAWALGNQAFFVGDTASSAPDEESAIRRADELYRRALEIEPAEPRTVNNYANFLAKSREDAQGGCDVFEQALELKPVDPHLVNGYAHYALTVCADPDRADEVYRATIEIEPNDPEISGCYALFLVETGRDPAGGMALFEQVLERSPSHANTLGSYARVLLETGSTEDRLTLVDRALAAADHTNDALLLELHFYRLVFGPPEIEGEAMDELSRLISREVRSPGWNLNEIVARARIDEDPDVEWLQALADVIVGQAEPETLSGWEAWP